MDFFSNSKMSFVTQLTMFFFFEHVFGAILNLGLSSLYLLCFRVIYDMYYVQDADLGSSLYRLTCVDMI
jgi:hypothetical protein